jgi:hypothetical protein
LRANGSATSAADTASALIDFLHNPLQTDPKLNYIDPDFPTSTESLTNINLSVNGQASGRMLASPVFPLGTVNAIRSLISIVDGGRLFECP